MIFVYFLLLTLKYIHPLGEDGVIYIWPAGKAIADASSIYVKFKILFASFITEDHLSPIHHLYGYVLYLIGDRPEPIIMFATKLIFIAMVISSIWVYYSLFKCGKKTIFFSLLLSLDTAMTWRNMIFPVSFTIPIIPSLWSFYFLNRFLNFRARKDFWLCAIFFLVASFSFELSFVILPLLACFTVWFCFFNSPHEKIKDSILTVLLVGAVLFAALVPYLLIHYKLYGGVLPSSRIALKPNIAYQLTMLGHTLSQWNFGIPRGILKIALLFTTRGVFGWAILSFLLVAAVIFTFYFIKNIKKIFFISNVSVGLLGGVLFQICTIAYTGRNEPGMWTIAGVFYLYILSDCLYNFLSRVLSFRYLFVSTILILLPVNLLQPISALADGYYFFQEVDSTAAFRSINQNIDDFTIIKLPGAREQLHPTAFWLGNKIFNKAASLEYFEKYNMLMYKNMSLRIDQNPDEILFSDYSAEINSLITSTGTAVVVNDKNLYTRFFNSDNANQLESISTVISYAPKDSFSLKLLPNEHGQSEIVLKFSTCLEKESLNNFEITVNDKPIMFNKMNDCNLVKFTSAYLRPGKENTLKLPSDMKDLDQILIYSKKIKSDKEITSFVNVKIETLAHDCLYGIHLENLKGVSWTGSVHPGTSKIMTFPASAVGKKLFIHSRRYEINRNLITSEPQSLVVANNLKPIQLCSQ